MPHGALFSRFYTALNLTWRSSVLTDFFTYMIGSIGLRALVVVISPFILTKISPAEYGIISLVTSSIGIITPVLGLGLRQVVSLEYFHLQGNQKKELLNDILILYTALALCICTIVYTTQPYWLATTAIDPLQASVLIALGLCIAFTHFFIELLYQILRYEQLSLYLTYLQLCIASIGTSTTLLLLYVYTMGMHSMLYGQLASTTVGCCIGIYVYADKQMHSFIDMRRVVKKSFHYIKYGLPFIPNSLCSWIVASADRWFLAQQSSLTAVGLYTVADTFGQLFQLLVLNSWAGAYLPYILKQYAQNPETVAAIERTNRRVMWSTLIGLSCAILITMYCARPLLLFLLPSSYHEVLIYVPTLLLGHVFLLGSFFATALIQFYKKKVFLACNLFIPAVINCLLNFILIPHFGLHGCTYATLCAYATHFAITLAYNHIIQKNSALQTQ